MNTIEMVKKMSAEKDTLVCVGLDPDIKYMPHEFTSAIDISKPGSAEDATFGFLREVIDITQEYACAFKLQKAFYDRYERGTSLLSRTVSYIKKTNPDMPAIVDAKIGDISNTFGAYMELLFEDMHADGVVVNPYMGDDIFEFALKYPEKAFVVLVRTSNDGAGIVQDAELASGKRLWEYILSLSCGRWNEKGNLIVVMSSRLSADYTKIRKSIPDQMPILVVGMGVQKGSIDAVRQLLNSEKAGLLINSSRAILYPYSQDDKEWRGKIRKSAMHFREEINTARR